MTARIGSLCSGYGGLDMAVCEVLGGQVAWHAEYDDAPAKILAHHWPTVPNLRDITAIDWSQVLPVDVLTAGYPCPPFSSAGLRKGTTDARHLWPYVASAVRALRPSLVVLENVSGHLSLGLDTVLADLAGLGYMGSWGLLRAADAGAPHNRARVFVVAADPAHDQLEINTSNDCVGRERATQWRRPVVTAGSRRDGADPGGSLALPYARHRTAAAGDQGAATNSDSDGRALVGRVEPVERDADRCGREDIPWGPYESAVRRWEHFLGRPAPRPTEPGARSGERLSPRFVEWMMGVPDGHITAVPGLTRNEQLKVIGNGVVPQQAALALRTLLPLLTEQVAA